MSAKSAKLILIVCLLAGVLLCVLGYLLASTPNRNPVRSLKIEMDFTEREEFFTQMQEFADKHLLESKISLYGSTNFILVMYGDGYQIIAGGVEGAAGKIEIDFEVSGTNLIRKYTAGELFNDLKSFLGKIPNAIIIELP